MQLHEAQFYEARDTGTVQCRLCPQNCLIAENSAGFCRSRVNVAGTLYTLVYGKTTGMALDPIEKKPLYHFHPGEYILSLGTRGCNLACMFCQNWRISQNPEAGTNDVTPEGVVSAALRQHSFGIAYTYNEPFIWFEFVLDCCRMARGRGLENVLITNGYVNAQPLEQVLPYIGAMNIDIKSMDDDFYRDICKGSLSPVLETIVRSKEKCHIELTNLLIPGRNDSDEHVRRLTDWIFTNTGADTPVHFSRYFPCYHMDEPPTPVETLERAAAIARKKLTRVYLGNV